jgi:hypothetical protein
LEFDENGFPILRVGLRALETPEITRQFRFLISTGFDKTIIDLSVPSDFYWEDAGAFHYQDTMGTLRSYPAVLLKHVEVAGLGRDGIAGARVNLRATMGQTMDDPVDGVLGMSFMVGTRFVFDPGARRIQWWQRPFKGATLPLTYAADHTPLISLMVGQNRVTASVDLGRMGGLDLPWSVRPTGEAVPRQSQAMVGAPAPGQALDVECVEAGPGAWSQVQGYFQPGIESGAIGLDVWSAAPVCFDFIQNQLTLQLGEGNQLPIQAPGRISIPVLWDRTGAAPKLKVAAVTAGTPMDKAGCRPGDELIKAAGLAGPTLNRRNLLTLLAQKKPHVWTVRRGEQEVNLFFFEPNPFAHQAPTGSPPA